MFVVDSSVVLFFFFKQKTAYEMRISDWSSDVCSSDLPELHAAASALNVPLRFAAASDDVAQWLSDTLDQPASVRRVGDYVIAVTEQPLDAQQIGRPRGRLAVIGLGPGAAELMVPAVRAELERATDRKSTRLNSSHQCASRMPS